MESLLIWLIVASAAFGLFSCNVTAAIGAEVTQRTILLALTSVGWLLVAIFLRLMQR